MSVAMINFDREIAKIGDEVRAAVNTVLDSGWYILGEQVERFEDRFADYVGTEYGVGVNSGTDALVLSLRALGVGHGDEVITVSHSATATSAAIVETGATPVYVDIDPDSMLMNAGSVADQITDRTAAILPVHLYGDAVDLDEVGEIAQAHDIPIVEDCAQAHGARYGDSSVGSVGACSAFSFYPTKNLGAYGDGGIVTTDDENINRRLVQLREYGWEENRRSEMAGKNSRLDEIQAAILNVKLNHLPEWNERRRENAKIYDEHIADMAIRCPPRRDETTHVYHQYVIRTEDRDGLREFLDENGISTQIHYPNPNHRQKGYTADVALPNTDRICDRILSLPVHHTVSEEEVNTVVKTLSNW